MVVVVGDDDDMPRKRHDQWWPFAVHICDKVDKDGFMYMMKYICNCKVLQFSVLRVPILLFIYIYSKKCTFCEHGA